MKLNLPTCFSWPSSRRSRKGLTCLVRSPPNNSKPAFGPVDTVRRMSTPSASRAKKQALDRDMIISVLESAATRRDAKGYLQKYTHGKTPCPSAPSHEPAAGSPVASLTNGRPTMTTTTTTTTTTTKTTDPTDAAVVTLRLPQELSSDVLHGIAKTLSQLRVLGLTALVVVDGGAGADCRLLEDQALRLCEAIDSFAGPGSKMAGHVFSRRKRKTPASTPPGVVADTILVDDRGVLERALRRSVIVVMPSLARPDDISCRAPADANATTLALTRYLAGFPSEASSGTDDPASAPTTHPSARLASVERIIILDPLGGIPMTRRPHVPHRLINLEQEYDMLLQNLKAGASTCPETAGTGRPNAPNDNHAANLSLVKDTLTLLPPTSSALITTPFAAACTSSSTPPTAHRRPLLGFDSMVTTRRQRNPLLHNLLTNRPAFSPSLPLKRIQDEEDGSSQRVNSGSATLVKRGMPVTIYPDPRVEPWRFSKPTATRLRLTDDCFDLARLLYLIEDSFNRKLDAQHYLKRVNDNLAGVIIAGEYEGAAILTWELPVGVSEQDACAQRRFVPYLDKFAVLKTRQGCSGVADIVFNAMVQDCFPDGVCWRSRKDNPVNKWYFERSAGTCQLSASNWAMFWTTMDAKERSTTLQDYESVCRSVEPSWADKKHVID
ncbi:uncharacterized protein UV8b_00960 [Ustilaginoidea virens]|uniref:Amino-acid acetyltransferase, mitochondrial n=1 Tax=Ustilaginoidea virens TaxID=1159556 RepID=A0A8E5HJU2_USTVR|nr:uncharacterized protein UV8b_00960 [Ustilaginoidea virens]QUC16719.1 hypothetical protein UV8b_00960 [Ustilaginoidea virens]